MEFDKFTKLLNDFDVYPSLISKGNVHNIFTSINNLNKKNGSEKQFINETQF